jgi:MFS family permease
LKETTMKKKQFFALFFGSLAMWTAGNGLLPLLPVYATKLGATPNIVGYYLSIVYIAITSGTIIAGWLSDKWQQRKALVFVVGIIGVPVIWFMGRVTNIWQLTILTGTLWFLGGMGLTLITILAGLSAEKSKRGRLFGLFFMVAPLDSYK